MPRTAMTVIDLADGVRPKSLVALNKAMHAFRALSGEPVPGGIKAIRFAGYVPPNPLSEPRDLPARRARYEADFPDASIPTVP